NHVLQPRKRRAFEIDKNRTKRICVTRRCEKLAAENQRATGDQRTMKLLVVMASRDNPKGLLAVISSAMYLASGNHEIQIRIGIDKDDTSSLVYSPTIKKIYSNVEFVILERQPTLGGVVNFLAQGIEADAYIPLTDRMLIQTENWDEIIINAS